MIRHTGAGSSPTKLAHPTPKSLLSALVEATHFADKLNNYVLIDYSKQMDNSNKWFAILEQVPLQLS